jgi:hypothetical protein
MEATFADPCNPAAGFGAYIDGNASGGQGRLRVFEQMRGGGVRQTLAKRLPIGVCYIC